MLPLSPTVLCSVSLQGERTRPPFRVRKRATFISTLLMLPPFPQLLRKTEEIIALPMTSSSKMILFLSALLVKADGANIHFSSAPLSPISVEGARKMVAPRSKIILFVSASLVQTSCTNKALTNRTIFDPKLNLEGLLLPRALRQKLEGIE